MLLSAEQLSINFGSRQLLQDVDFYLNEGDKTGVIGINGTGKSTFLKVLAGLVQPDSGRISRRPNLQVSYLPQNPEMDDDRTILEQVFASMPPQFRALNEYEAKAMLTKLGLGETDRRIGTLSGGERRRAALCAALIHPADVLVLDEPTNHLDIPSREALEAALLDFGGTMLVVSHDRYFINKLSTRVLSIGMNGAESFEGGYDDHAAKIAEQSAEKPKAAKTMGKGGEDYKRRKERESELRRTITAIKKCEERINELDGLIAKTNEEMSTPEAAADYARVMELTETLGKLNDEQTELMMQWEELENRKAQLEGEE